MITEALVQRLRLQRTSAPVTILGIGGHRATSSKGKVIVTLSSRISTFCMSVSALVLPRISAYSSRVQLTGNKWPHTNGLQLAASRPVLGSRPGGTPARNRCLQPNHRGGPSEG